MTGTVGPRNRTTTLRRSRRAETAPPAGRHLTVATYNIHTCVGVDRRYDPDRIAAVLRELGADIICLQEVDARHRHDGNRDQWAYFAAVTGLNVVSSALLRPQRGRFGNAILTRFPVLAERHIDLSVGGYEPRGAIDADLQVDGQVLRVVATHLGLHTGERRFQIERLLETALEDGAGADGLLLMGDLNEWRRRQGGIRGLDRRLGRAPALRTFPSWLPVLPLDRIYAAGGAALGPVSVHRSSLARVASDHLPLKAVVGLARIG